MITNRPSNINPPPARHLDIIYKLAVLRWLFVDFHLMGRKRGKSTLLSLRLKVAELREAPESLGVQPVPTSQGRCGTLVAATS